MDARVSELKSWREVARTDRLPAGVARKSVTPRSGSRGRRKGKEVVKAGMAASLAVTLLTGLKWLRPMSMHPVAAWAFLGLTVVHMLMYEKPSNGKKVS